MKIVYILVDGNTGTKTEVTPQARDVRKSATDIPWPQTVQSPPTESKFSLEMSVFRANISPYAK